MKTVSVRLPEDVAARVDQYADERGVSRSEAVRRLIGSGLEADRVERRVERLERRVERLERPVWERWFR